MLDNIVETRTPYAYAFGAMLIFMSEQMNDMTKKMNMDIMSVAAIDPRLIPVIKDKYDYCMENIFGIYDKMNLAFDMAIPDEEKQILDEQYETLKRQVQLNAINKIKSD